MKKIIILIIMCIVLSSSSLAANSWDTGNWTNFWSHDTVDIDGSISIDSKGNNNGTIIDTTNLFDGLINESMNVTDGYILTDKVGYVDDGQAFTVAGWFNSNTNGADKGRIVGIQGDVLVSNVRIDLSLDTDKVQAVVKSNNGNLLTLAGPMSANKWHFVVITFDGTSDHRFYINGSLHKNQTMVQINFTTGSNWTIGAQPEDPTNPVGKFDGLIDEVNIWYEELTPTQITDLYNHGKNHLRADELAPGIDITLSYPVKNRNYNYNNTNITKRYNGYINATTSKNSSCILNDTRFTKMGSNFSFTHSWFNNTLITDGLVGINITCVKPDENLNGSIVFNFSIDTIPPNITLFNFVNNQKLFSNLDLNLSVFDINLLYVNTKIKFLGDNSTKYLNQSGILNQEYYNITKMFSFMNRTFWPKGNYSIEINTSDRFLNNQTLNIKDQIFYFNIVRTDLNISIFNASDNQLITHTNVTILINTTPITLNQTDTGNLLVLDIVPTDYLVFASAPGFESSNFLLTVNEGDINNLSIFLIDSQATNKFTYFVKDRENNNIIEGATVTLLQRIEGIFQVVNQQVTDFASTVSFEQDPDGIYKLNISATGFETRLTDEYQPNVDLTPYVIFMESLLLDKVFNIFDFVTFTVNPTNTLVDNSSIEIDFITKSNTSRIIQFGWNSTINGTVYSASETNSNGGNANNIIDLTNLSLGSSFPVDFFITYSSDVSTETYEFRRIYLRSALNKTINITLFDTLTLLSDEIDEEQKNPLTVKTICTILLTVLVILMLVVEGFVPVFATGIAMLIILGAALFGFFDMVLAIIMNFIYWIYFFIIMREEF